MLKKKNRNFPIFSAVGINNYIGEHSYNVFELASRELVDKAHRHGLMVFAWTLNTEEEFRKAVEIGVDGFASDDPCLARREMQYRG